MKIILACIFTFQTMLLAQTIQYFGPHLAGSEPWNNHVVILNSGSKDASFQIQVWGAGGELIEESSHTVASGYSYDIAMSSQETIFGDLNLEPVNGSFMITTTSDELAPLMTYQFGDSASISQFLLSPQLSQQFLLPHMESEEDSWTGIVIMNPLDQAVSVEIQACGDGESLNQTSFQISAHGKWISTLQTLWPDLDPARVQQIKVASDQELPCPVLLTGNEAQDRHLLFLGAPVASGEVQTNTASYNLYAPLNSTQTYLIDEAGDLVHTWQADYPPGNAVYLNEDGSIWHTGNVSNPDFQVGGAGGSIQRIAWDGSLEWDYTYSSSTYLQHHDIEPLPNGNILFIAWEWYSYDDVVDMGRASSSTPLGGFWLDSVVEVRPMGANSGEVVWAWHLADHLVQDHDSLKPGYGNISDHPELVDINANSRNQADFTHINSIDYNAEFDQILLSVHNTNEIWIIDHSTSQAEAAGHSGGRSGKGGDLLYRWGNPKIYGRGNSADQVLFGQHDAEWIAEGLPGAGHILIFNNGGQRPGGNASSVDELELPVTGQGNYVLETNQSFGPTELVWTYQDEQPTNFYAQNISGSQRLPNGDTLICDGPHGLFFEVTPQGEKVWQYDSGSAAFRVDRYDLDLKQYASKK